MEEWVSFKIIDKGSCTALLLFVSGLALSIYLTPDFDLNESYFSSLGNRQEVTTLVSGTRIVASPFPEIFNFTLIFSSILFTPIAIFQVRLLSSRSKGISFAFLHAFWISWILAMIFLAFVGIIDVGTNYPYHLLMTVEFFAFATFAIFYRLIFILTSPYRFCFSKWDISLSFFLTISSVFMGYFGKIYTKIKVDFIYQRIFLIGLIFFVFELIRSNRKMANSFGLF